MNSLLRLLPSSALTVFIINPYINLDYVLIAMSTALLAVTAYSVRIFFQDRKQIRLLVIPTKRIYWLEIAYLVIVTAVLITFMVLIYKESAPERKHISHFLILFPAFCTMLQLCANVMFVSMNNSALYNSHYYLSSYLFLESGLKKDGIMRKKYPWDHFMTFEVDPLEHTIYLVLKNGNKLTLPIKKKDFDLHLPAIEIFLREKISFKNIPASL